MVAPEPTRREVRSFSADEAPSVIAEPEHVLPLEAGRLPRMHERFQHFRHPDKASFSQRCSRPT